MNESARTRTVIAVIAAVGAAFVTLTAALVIFTTRSFTTSWGEKIAGNERYLTIEGQTFTQEDLERVAGMRRLRMLELKDCNIAECRLPELRFASKELYDVSFEGTGLWDTSFLKDLPVRRLDLTDCSGVDSIENLNWEKIDTLHIDGTDVTDLSPAKGSQLWELTFARTGVEDLSPVATLEYLDEIDGSYTKVRSIDVLAGMTGLNEVRFDGCPLKRVNQPFRSEYLNVVSLANTDIRDMSAFSSCPVLRELNLGGCRRLESMDWMSPQVKENLVELNLARTKFAPDELSWIASCHKLEKLTLDGVSLDNLDLCRDLQELTAISAVGCGITDVSGIKGCKNLSTILLGYNRIQNIEDLPRPDFDYPQLELDLSHNQLDSLAKLPKGEYRLLLLQGNGPDAARTIPAGVASYETAVSWFSGIDDSRLRDFSLFSDIYLLDCPSSEVDKLSETFYAYRLKLVAEEELLDLLEANELNFWLDTDFSWYAPYVRDNLLEGTAAE